jgi:circadian clock protein KaiC
MERISTGISGLDALIEGGIPTGFTILVAGNPGTGKTILTSHFLHEGLLKGESTVYVSFSESKSQYYANTERFDMSFRKFENGGKNTFTFLDFTSVGKEGMQVALDELLSVIQDTNSKRIVIDSFSAIAQAFDNQNEARIALQVILGKITRAHGVTSMIITEVPHGKDSVGSGIEEFVADGIIKLEHGTTNAIPMTLRIMKMRGTAMNREAHVVNFGSKGIVVFEKYPLNLQYSSSEKRITSGIASLDEKMEGGILQGSTTALVGASGVGKTTFAFQFIAEGVKAGEPGIFLSLEESPKQLARMASKYGYDVNELEAKGLTLVSIVAEETSADAFVSILSSLIAEKKPARLVIDSISAFEHIYEKEMYPVTKRIVSLCHDNQITTIFTILTEQASGINLTTVGVSSLFENIIMLRYVEAEGRMKRSLLLFKMRATAHDESILEFTISEKGIEVVGDMSAYVGIMTGVAQKVKQEFEAEEKRIAKEEADARKKRLEDYEDRQRKVQADAEHTMR